MYTRWNHQIVLLIVAITLSATAVFAGQQSQDGVWQQVDKSELRPLGIDSPALPTAFETFRLNRPALEAILRRAPEEFTSGQAAILSLPMPDGTFSRFAIEHSLVVERGLLEKYPELGATYRARGIDDPTAYARFDLLPVGFHLMVLTTRGTIIVNPYAPGDTENYISFFKQDMPFTGEWRCYFNESEFDNGPLFEPKGFDQRILSLRNAAFPDVTSGSQLRTYRLALAANNEYCVAVGSNTVAGSLAAQVLIMNRVNGVYERDVAIHMNIIANNNLIVYAGDNLTCPVPGGNMACNSGNDPYSNDTGALNQNTPNLNTVIGSANYDIGHVFTTGSGGVAFLGVPCGGNKGGGTTGLPNPVGDPFAIDYVAHEMGHQWGGQHTFNGVTSNCGGGNRSASAAYEPGSGISVMAYAGICGSENLSNHSIDTFHVKSLEQIVNYSQNGQGNTCAATTASGNTPPTVAVLGGPTFNVPKTTPFILTATGTDPDGDPLTYDWEQYDLGPQSPPQGDSDGQARPLFRPYLPLASPSRTYPSLQFILNNANVPPPTTGGFLTGENLPSITRTMHFQVVARDNHAGTGGINTATATVSVDGNSGPFGVTSPNGGESLPGGNIATITWNVANTNNPPVSAAQVNILMSTDGGNTFPTTLASAAPNNGSAFVLIPIGLTSIARVKIEAVGNIFFDISNGNFSVVAGGGTPSPIPTQTPFTPSPNPTPTPTPTPCGASYTVSQIGGSIVPGTTDIGNHGDDTVTTVALPFSYTLYDQTFTSVRLSSNGNAQFTTTDTEFENQCLPWSAHNYTIYPYWDDLYLVNAPNGIFTSVSGTAPNRIFNIEWRAQYFPGSGSANLELRLYEGQTRFDVIYGTVSAANSSATAGVQKNDTTFGQYFCDGTGAPATGGQSYILSLCGSPTPTPAVTPTRTPTPTPTPPATRAVFDFDGDNKTDVSVWRASVGQWWLSRSTQGILGVAFGASTDIPRAADYTGDHKTDIAFFHPSTNEWFVLRSEDFSYYAFPWGSNGDITVTADFDGDGRADPAVYRPSQSTWYILRSTGGVTTVPFGISTDLPVPADYDGDGRADIAIYRPALGQWWILNSGNGQVFAATFGVSTDKPVPGDYTGDGRADLAFFRPSDGNWYVLRSENMSYYAFPWGASTDKLAPGDYDGDGRFDAAVYRQSDTNWYILRSSGGVTIYQFGITSDVPVPGQSIP